MKKAPKTTAGAAGLLPVPEEHPADSAPAFSKQPIANREELRRKLGEACTAWLLKSQSYETRSGYSRELAQFLLFCGMPRGEWEFLVTLRPSHVAAWRDSLLERGLTNSSVSRKLSVVRSLFGYLRNYGYAGANPADTAVERRPPPDRSEGKGRQRASSEGKGRQRASCATAS